MAYTRVFVFCNVTKIMFMSTMMMEHIPTENGFVLDMQTDVVLRVCSGSFLSYFNFLFNHYLLIIYYLFIILLVFVIYGT